MGPTGLYYFDPRPKLFHELSVANVFTVDVLQQKFPLRAEAAHLILVHCLHEVVTLFDQRGHAVYVLVAGSRQSSRFNNESPSSARRLP